MSREAGQLFCIVERLAFRRRGAKALVVRVAVDVCARCPARAAWRLKRLRAGEPQSATLDLGER
jgi:hypothetical protein